MTDGCASRCNRARKRRLEMRCRKPVRELWFYMSVTLLTVAGLLAATTTAHAAIPASERAALVALYNATNGPNWTNKTNWLGSAVAWR